MTPVEERIDYEEAAKIADMWLKASAVDVGNEAAWEEEIAIARAYLSLLTEHSARVKLQERIERVYPLAAQIRREMLTTPELPPEQEDHEQPCEHGIAWGEFCPRCPDGGV